MGALLQVVQQFCERAGAEWVIGVLVILLAVVCGLTVQRVWAVRALSGDPTKLLDVLAPIFRGDQLVNDMQSRMLNDLRMSPSVAAALSQAALSQAHRGARAAETAVEGHVLIERLRLERGLSILSTVASNAPFVGLLGTVIGVMHAFSALGAAAPGQSEMTAKLMQGVAEALVTTGVGLAVALPAVVAHNYLQQKSDAILSGARALASQLIASMPELPLARQMLESEKTWP